MLKEKQRTHTVQFQNSLQTAVIKMVGAGLGRRHRSEMKAPLDGQLTPTQRQLTSMEKEHAFNKWCQGNWIPMQKNKFRPFFATNTKINS
jgi:hypothetical protein